jgi:hypothetical protein
MSDKSVSDEADFFVDTMLLGLEFEMQEALCLISGEASGRYY